MVFGIRHGPLLGLPADVMRRPTPLNPSRAVCVSNPFVFNSFCTHFYPELRRRACPERMRGVRSRPISFDYNLLRTLCPEHSRWMRNETLSTPFPSIASALFAPATGGGATSLLTTHKKNVQISPFVFNKFQDAPPATPFFSHFCIAAGGCIPSGMQTILFRRWIELAPVNSDAPPRMHSAHRRARGSRRAIRLGEFLPWVTLRGRAGRPSGPCIPPR